jgi:hypothetical protein
MNVLRWITLRLRAMLGGGADERDAHGMRWMDTLAGDLRFARRYFARNNATTTIVARGVGTAPPERRVRHAVLGPASTRIDAPRRRA